MIGDVYVGPVGGYPWAVGLCNVDQPGRAVSEVFGCISVGTSDGRDSSLSDNAVRLDRGAKRWVQEEYERGQVKRPCRNEVGGGVSSAQGLSDGSIDQPLVGRHRSEAPFPDTVTWASVNIDDDIRYYRDIRAY